MLTVLKEWKSDNIRHLFTVCDCGNFNLFKVKIQLGRNSCGCLVKKSIDNLVASIKKEESVAAFNEVYGSYQRVAKKRGYSFDLSREEFRLLTSNNCFYCNAPPSNKMQRATRNGSFTYSGIDRIDSNEGYKLDNVVSCCAVCNGMKMSMTQNEFISHIKRMLSMSKVWRTAT